jgi:hypothetical protein
VLSGIALSSLTVVIFILKAGILFSGLILILVLLFLISFVKRTAGKTVKEAMVKQK